MSENKTQSSFRRIVKGTAIFGGTQMVTMVINIVRGKLVASILGAHGMGFSSHQISTITPIQMLFTFGLNTSAVKVISSATDEYERSSHVKCFRRLILVLSLMAMCSTIACSRWLSIITFETPHHWHWFVILATAILFLMQGAAEATILQAYRALHSLAICNIVPPLIGLVIAVPFFLLWGIEGIAPSVAAIAILSWGINRYFTQKLHIQPVPQSWRTTLNKGRDMLSLGGILMIGGLLGALSVYLINTIISRYGSEEAVGLYQAANTITVQCAAFIFTAMGTDFFPHLASIIHDRTQTQRLICQQGEIVLLLTIPLALLLITFAPLIIRIILTSEFNSITFLLRAMSVSLISRAVCFPLDYICIARGDNTYYFLMEGIWTNIKTVALVTVGYILDGLDGIGIALMIGAVLDILVSILCNLWRYGITYSASYYRLGSILTLALLAGMAASFIPSSLIAYSVMAIITIATTLFVYRKIDQRINIRNLIKQKYHARS